ncbi:MAG: PAS domain-containing protein, partial [Deltaproteobacteria bacterium]|nr:PAS domain-containing protein [Deltaproteobacteria bacterium]
MDKEKLMLNAILNTVDDGIYVIAQDYTIEFMNQKMIDMFGDGVGIKCHKVINNSDSLCEWCRSSEVFEGKRICHEIFAPKADKAFK